MDKTVIIVFSIIAILIVLQKPLSLLEYFIRRKYRDYIFKKKVKNRKYYFGEIEPKYRKLNKYPPDWQIRRREIYAQHNGICQDCYRHTGQYNISIPDRWLGRSGDVDFMMNLPKSIRRFYTVNGCDVHHIVPLSKGGDNSFSNLTLLCKLCHLKRHPKNKGLKSTYINSHRISRDGFKLKKSNKQWVCEICNKTIYRRKLYYSKQNYGNTTKICCDCYIYLNQ